MGPVDDAPTDEYSFLLTSGDEEPLHVRFEPLGPEYTIAAGDHLRISVRSPSADPIEITSERNWITIWSAPVAEVRAVNASGVRLHFLI